MAGARVRSVNAARELSQKAIAQTDARKRPKLLYEVAAGVPPALRYIR